MSSYNVLTRASKKSYYGDLYILYHHFTYMEKFYLEIDPSEMTDKDYLDMSITIKSIHDVKNSQRFIELLVPAIEYLNEYYGEDMKKDEPPSYILEKYEAYQKVCDGNLLNMMMMLVRKLSLRYLWCKCGKKEGCEYHH